MSSREQFETWYLENWGHTEDHHETLFERDPDDEYGYYRLGVRMAHQAWQAATSAMEAKCAALAAENARLNEKMNKLATWPGIEFYSSAWEFNGGDGDTALEFMCDTETPATDAFLAEVRAQGVEMFAALLAEMDISCTERGALTFAAQLRQEAAQ